MDGFETYGTPRVRRLVLTGPTGAGKSWLGNLLLENDLWLKPGVDEKGKKRGEVFTTSPGQESQTDKISYHKSEVNDFAVGDTPGLGDTKGNSIEYLDDIITAVKDSDVDAVLLVMNALSRMTAAVKESTRCLGECLKRSVDAEPDIDPTRIIVVLNRIDEDEDSMGPEGFRQWLEQQIKVCQDELAERLGIGNPRKLNVIPVQRMKKEAEKREGLAVLKDQLDRYVPKGRRQMNTKGFRTWKTVIDEAEEYKKGRVQAATDAEKSRKQAQEAIDYHREKIEDCRTAHIACLSSAAAATVAAAASGGVLSGAAIAAGLALEVATAALQIAIIESEAQTPALEKKLKESKDDLPGYRKRQEIAEKLLEDLKEYATIMGKNKPPRAEAS